MTDAPSDSHVPAHSIEIEVRWGDMDAMGHVNNSVFFTYFEQARVSWLAASDWGGTGEGGGPVVVSASCDYLRPVIHPARVRVDLTLGPPGNKSIPTRYVLRDADAPGTVYAHAEAIMVWVGADGRSAPLPDAVRRLVEAQART